MREGGGARECQKTVTGSRGDRLCWNLREAVWAQRQRWAPSASWGHPRRQQGGHRAGSQGLRRVQQSSLHVQLPQFVPLQHQNPRKGYEHHETTAALSQVSPHSLG